ncbi:MAG: hypothetical protein PHR28_09040 [candidate division Zixibacteria bacterium]|nr:hypothetical protein [candidate division Zixibacteria bacterium]
MMTRNVVFVSIFDLTKVFFEISRGLKEAGHRVFWIATDPYWTEWLIAKGVRRENLLPLVYTPRDFLDNTAQATLRDQIVRAESTAGLTAAESLLMDQFVAAKNPPHIEQYVYLYYRHIKRFLIENKISHLFAEATNLNELIAYIVCRELGVTCLAPGRLRYPADRFVFFDGYLQHRLHPRPDGDQQFSGRELIDDFAANLPRPHFFADFSRMRVVTPDGLKRSLVNRIRQKALFGRPNLTHHHLDSRIRLMLKRVNNSFYARHICRYDRLEQIQGRVAFYPLHVQPEASIDVLGSHVSDQLDLIKNIRRALPFDTTLVVKEHPNFLGMKDLTFFRALRRIPGVKLLHHDVSNFDIYRRAAIVFTVSGTSGLEAGLLGIPAVTFSPMYYGDLSTVRYCSDLTKLREMVFGLRQGYRRDLAADCAAIENMTAASYDGFWSGPNYYPQVLALENIARLVQAFASALEIESPAAIEPSPQHSYSIMDHDRP